MSKIKITVWNEFRHEKQEERIAKIYPKGIHQKLAEGLGEQPDFDVRTATLDEPEHGLTQGILDNTDVLLWWGHMAHHEVEDRIIDRVQKRVLDGMGLIVLHSGHHSKIFKRLMGTSCDLIWRESDEKERLWVVEPFHPIAQGVGPYIELQKEEMYGERFDIPQPDKIIFISWFQGGEVFRSGVTFTRGLGKIFYFRPGHESYPTFHDKRIIKVLCNAIRWARFSGNRNVSVLQGQDVKPLEKLNR